MNLPLEIVSLLKKERVCFLATSLHDQPHLSLMNFTFLPEEGLIILSSRRNTKKVTNILNNPQVALLVYQTGDEQPPISATIFGRGKVESGESEGAYRAIHADRNKNMSQFIIGPNIVIITLRIEKVMVSDLQDEVSEWSCDP